MEGRKMFPSFAMPSQVKQKKFWVKFLMLKQKNKNKLFSRLDVWMAVKATK